MQIPAVVLGAGLCLLASPYLAGLTITVPDRANRRWWRTGRVGARRLMSTALTGIVLGAVAGAASGWTAALPAFLALALSATPLVLIDVEHHRLPDRLVTVAALGVALLPSHQVRALEAAVVVFAALGALMLAAPRSFGFGDVKLGAVLAAYLGWFGWPAVLDGLLAGFVLGALVALGLMLARRATRRTAIAFGPWLILGALLVAAFPPV